MALHPGDRCVVVADLSLELSLCQRREDLAQLWSRREAEGQKIATADQWLGPHLGG